ncbi:MAG: endonuclease [Candidatus Gallionella acididurans]|uniref:Endonuclease n=1 Tax=Candidatus Gallionella acididurans TaxID=1796491 RepID=A0A139BRQ9_9PROT|nr:MAG: endonuclease [Candidatus Gallionella acididurans]
MSREEWLSVRGGGIGSSDAAVAVGISPYKSPLELWLEKTNRQPAPDLSDNDAVFWGTTLEHIIANVYAERTGAKVRKLNSVLQHPDYLFMLANLDRLVQHPTDGSGILEVKTAGVNSAKFWEEGVPDSYQCQVLHQLAVTGKQWCDVAVLIGGQDFRIYRVIRDDAKIADLIRREEQFWQCVIQDIPPAVDGSESSGKALASMYPADKGEVLDCTEDTSMNKLFSDYWAYRQQRETAEDQENLLKQRLQERLGFASGAVLDCGKISWRKSKDSTETNFKKLTAENPELVARYEVSKPGSRRFLVQIGGA